MSVNLNGINNVINAYKDQVSSYQKDSATSFTDTLKKTMEELNAMEKQVESDSQALAAGTLNSPHEALVNAEKAELALELVLQVRNKCLDAYNEIMRMNI